MGGLFSLRPPGSPDHAPEDRARALIEGAIDEYRRMEMPRHVAIAERRLAGAT